MALNDQVARLRIVNKKELKELVGYSDVHILRLEKAGKFPRRVQIGENRVGWRLGDILDWLDAKQSAVPKAHLSELEVSDGA